jgi:acetyl-CoA synthetase
LQTAGGIQHGATGGRVLALTEDARDARTGQRNLIMDRRGRERPELGPVAVIGELSFVQLLPKTRSGKIMRRVLKAVILDRDAGDISTIEDEDSVAEAQEAWQCMKEEIAAQSGRGTA